MSTTYLVGVWAFLSIVWTTFYVLVYALGGEHMEFGHVASDILTPIAALLIFGGVAVKVIRSFQTFLRTLLR